MAPKRKNESDPRRLGHVAAGWVGLGVVRYAFALGHFLGQKFGNCDSEDD